MPDLIDLATVEIDRFEPLLHETFSARAWEGPDRETLFELELVRAVPHPTSAREGWRTPFSLFFKGPAGVDLVQSTYAVTHPQTGEMLLFMVPVARKEGQIQLQAVLN